MRSKIEPMKKFVKLLRRHRELLMNWFKSKGLSSGTIEGFNNRVKLTARKAYEFRAVETLQIALFHALGKMPEPNATHKILVKCPIYTPLPNSSGLLQIDKPKAVVYHCYNDFSQRF